MDQVNDGRFPGRQCGGGPLPARPGDELGDRSLWPWLPGSIVSQGGPDEWYVCVEVRALATLEDGRPPLAGTAEPDLLPVLLPRRRRNPVCHVRCGVAR